MWPVPGFRDENKWPSDLVPFEAETVKEGLVAFRGKTGDLTAKRSSPEFWRYLYSEYAEKAIPLRSRRKEVNDDLFTILPTAERPWSAEQLRQSRPDVAENSEKSRGELVKRWKRLRDVQPAYDFDMVDLAFHDTTALSCVLSHTYSHYIPWKAADMYHFLIMLVPDFEPVPVPTQLTHDNQLYIRSMVIKHCQTNPLLRRYLTGLTPAQLSDQHFVRVAPIDTLLMTYTLWNTPLGKEMSEDMLSMVWATAVILRTYEALHSVNSSVTYKGVLKYLADSDKYQLFNSPAGVLALDPQTVTQAQAYCIQLTPFVPFDSLPFGRSEISDRCDSLSSQLEANNNHLAVTKQQMQGIDSLLHLLYRKIPEFQWFTCTVAAQAASLQMFYHEHSVKAVEQPADEAVKPGRALRARAVVVKAPRKVVRPKEVSIEQARSWLEQKATPTQKALWVKKFEQDSQVWPREVVPVNANSSQFQRYIAKMWKVHLLPEVDLHPSASNCPSGPPETKKHFIDADQAQQFASDNFHPGNLSNGRAIIHSPGAGKTGLVVRVGSVFARAGYRVVWVTKASLRNQVLKNHVNQIFNLLIQQEYDRLHFMQGLKQAQSWLQSLPAQTNPELVFRMLRSLGMEWMNLSYRVFSNALEQKNELGRGWYAEAQRVQTDTVVDPLRQTLLIFDEVHKMYTGELDRSELPNVSVIKESIQRSYRQSREFRVRVLLLTATPIGQSVLPLRSMINLLHEKDVFDHEMQTLDPHVTGKDAMVRHAHEVEQANREAELKVAQELFPPRVEHKRAKRTDDEEDEEKVDAEAVAFYNTASILGSSSSNLKRDTRNHVQEFWAKTYGLISKYDISADYSKFPRTEFMPMVLPSCTMFQERLMVSELASSKRTEFGSLARKIRHISAWARYELSGTSSRQPQPLDALILKDNAGHKQFEPTLADLRQRCQNLEILIQDTLNKPEHPDDVAAVADWQVSIDKLNEKLRKAESPSNPARKADRTREIKKLMHQLGNEEILRDGFLTRLQNEKEDKERKVAHLTKKLDRVRAMIAKEKKKHPDDQRHALVDEELKQFLGRLDEADALAPEDPNPKRKSGRQPKKVVEQAVGGADEDEEENDDSAGLAQKEADEEFDFAEKNHDKLKEDYYIEKRWVPVVKPLPTEQPKRPKKHYFDQPDHFSAKDFKEDMPLYSPKLAELMYRIQQNDSKCAQNQDLRKRVIYCEDMYTIRAVAGGLMAHGWTFGMDRQHVRWEKTYYRSSDNTVLTKQKSKAAQLTWLPNNKLGGKKADYNRFLILTRSRIGGVSGANLNEYAIHTVGANGEQATFNHADNQSGKDFRIVIIDRNFIEGVDLPASYEDFFDPVLSQADRTQIVGRVSRFCGNAGLPFQPDYGWHQSIYRYGLKFHSAGLHFTSSQYEKLHEQLKVKDSPWAPLVPEGHDDVFMDKLEKNLFSPVELQVLLDDNMDVQRLKKRSLDVYVALLDKVNIGGLLYEPAMRNLRKAKEDLDQLLMEEEETELEYKQEIFERDTRPAPRMPYVLRSRRRGDVLPGFEDLHNHTYDVVQYEVDKYFGKGRRKNTDAARNTFYRSVIVPLLTTADFVTVSEQVVARLVKDMLDRGFHRQAMDDSKHEAEELEKLTGRATKFLKKYRTKLNTEAERAAALKQLQEKYPKADADLFKSIWPTMIKVPALY